jgi:DNA-binding PadR family transcriptional regulator
MGMPRTANASRQTRALLAEFAAHPSAWRYGYELCKATGISTGTLYPSLSRLADQGLLETSWKPPAEPGRPPRHAYRLTSAGLQFARTQASAPMRSRVRRPSEAEA